MEPLGQKEWFESVLPTQVKPVTVADAVSASDSLMKQDAFEYASAEAKGQLQAAHALVCKIRDGDEPSMDENKTAWLKKVFEALPFFVRAQAQVPPAHALGDVEEGVAEQRDLVGKEALMHQWGEVKQKAIDEVLISDLGMLQIFSYLLPEKTKEEVNNLAIEVIKKVNRKRVAAPKAIPKDAQLKGKKKRKTTATADDAADSITRGLLGM